MNELHPTREQRDTAVGIGAGSAIFQVALDGQADGSQLAAYLMVAAREQLHLEQLVAVALGDGAIAQLSLLRMWHLMIIGVRLVLLLIAGEPVGQLRE